ncbi:MAG: hypothetical protein U0414_23685 [Polyangiaceae bacterium]
MAASGQASPEQLQRSPPTETRGCGAELAAHARVEGGALDEANARASVLGAALRADPDATACAGVARQTTDASLVATLFEDRDEGGVPAFQNPALPVELFERGLDRFGPRGVFGRIDEARWRALAHGRWASLAAWYAPLAVASELLGHADRLVRWGLAARYHGDASLLEALADDPDEGVRARVAEAKLTPTAVLERLAEDGEMRVRYAVARNPRTPADRLAKLARDAEGQVRRGVAENESAPAELCRRARGGRGALDHRRRRTATGDLARAPRAPRRASEPMGAARRGRGRDDAGRCGRTSRARPGAHGARGGRAPRRPGRADDHGARGDTHPGREARRDREPLPLARGSERLARDGRLALRTAAIARAIALDRAARGPREGSGRG